MKRLRSKEADVGIIVGRFQVHELHEAHKQLIDSVIEAHDSVLIFIGLSPVRGTTTDPLDFSARKRMFQEEYPDLNIYYIEDQWSDEVWSSNLDREIKKWTKPHQSVVLYGSRDSFIPHYHGKYPTRELDSDIYISGTEIRRRIANNFIPTKDYRAGVIAASFDRFPGCYTTVDIAIIDWTKNNILLVKKPQEDKLRFPGGFSSPESDSFEEDARREVYEETDVQADNYVYIGSKHIDDWRYRNKKDKIKTILFVATYLYGRPRGQDDVELAKWVPLDELFSGQVQVVHEHEPLVEMLQIYINSKIQDKGEVK